MARKMVRYLFTIGTPSDVTSCTFEALYFPLKQLSSGALMHVTNDSEIPPTPRKKTSAKSNLIEPYNPIIILPIFRVFVPDVLSVSIPPCLFIATCCSSIRVLWRHLANHVG